MKIKSKFFHFVRLLANKYFLALFVFLVCILFFDKYRLQVQMHLSQEIQNLEEDKKFYEDEKTKINKELDFINNNVEKYAREKYFLKKKDEDVFIIQN